MERRAISWVLILAVLVSFLNQRTVVSFAEGVEQKNQIKTDKVEMADTVTTLSIYYDDHIDIRGKKVDILDAGNPSSFQVGYGVEEQTPDPAVLCLEDDTLVAVGVGTAKVKIDGEIYEVEVTAAPISLLLLSGQSNMQGVNGNPSQSVICPIGQVYASFADGRILNRYTAEYLAPSALTGEGAEINHIGTSEFLSDYPVYALTDCGSGKGGPDSGLAYEWTKATGEKVWVVNTAQSGASINLFQKHCADYDAVVKLFSACQRTLKCEIAAGHYMLSHMGMFWCQGCADSSQSAGWYAGKFQSMYNNLKKDLSMDMDTDPSTPDDTLEFANIIMVLGGGERRTGYRAGSNRPKTDGYYATFKELEMRGPRVAQYWLGANPDLPEIHVVCNLGDSWVMMPDGTDGVEQYFQNHYENGRIDYTTHELQAEDWYKPKKPTDLKDSIHYNQIGYNEIGIETARNTCILLGYLNDSEEETTVRFVDWTGFCDIEQVKPAVNGQTGSLVVPLVTPVYRSKELSYDITDGLKYEYYDLLTSTYQVKSGTLSVVERPDITVSVG